MAISEQTDKIKPTRFTADSLPLSSGGFYTSLTGMSVTSESSFMSSSSRSWVSKNGHFHGISLYYTRQMAGGVFGGVV